MRWFTVDYLTQQPREQQRGTLVDVGFWLSNIPRLIPLCRLMEHRPVVDGIPETRPGQPGRRWVCCDRCGLRPDPQGNLDPVEWSIGDRYNGPYRPPLPHREPHRRDELRSLKGRPYAPGPWPLHPTGEVGGQLIVGRTFGGAGIEFTLGCAGSEHTLAGSVRLHHLGALHLHTQGFGQWLQRRLIPTGYDSRVIEIGIADGSFRWRFWCKDNEWSSDTPRWRDGSASLDPRDWLWGKPRTQVEKVGEPHPAIVRLPHGDDHEVTLQLKRWITRRPRRRGRPTCAWVVDWRCAEGIACHNHDGRGSASVLHGAQECVSNKSVETGSWAADGAAAVAARIVELRADHGFVTPETGTVSVPQPREG